ncbi:hypothetical protein BaRGS_00025454, partial [Batillaria attramentaria]
SVMSMTSSESAHSMTSSGSVELLSYQDALESVLTWLLEAEEAMEKLAPIASDVNTVKDQFNQHEEFMLELTVSTEFMLELTVSTEFMLELTVSTEFMLELTQHQDSIGAVLRDGNELITEGRVTPEEEHEIRVQMGLLNNRWEDLRVKALDRQARLQQVLMELQQQQLDELGAWLTSMEDRINKQEAVGSDLEAIKMQVEEHKLIQRALEEQQKRVDSLQNMVVVFCGNSGNDTYTACLAMEKQLETLGARWAAVCRWTEDQWVVLQEVLLRWQQFADEQTKFNEWLTEKEGVLDRMGKADLTDPDQVIVQVKHLKAIENDMGEQVRRFDALNECGQHIVRYVDSQAAVSRIASLLEHLQERWERLVQQMELHSNQIASSGVELSKISELYDVDAAEERVEKQTAKSLSTAKKRKVESAQRMEFDMQLKVLKEWFMSTESTLQLLVADNSQEPFTVEEQRVLVQDTENSVRSHQIDMQRVITLGKGVITELKIAGEATDSVATAIRQVEERWEHLNKILLDTQKQVERNFETKKFYSELTMLLELVAGYEKWVGTTEKIAEEAQEISKQLDQCKVKLRAMQAHQDRVERLKLHGEQIIRQFRSTDSIKDDLLSFTQRWQKAFNKIGERQAQLIEALEKAPPRTYLEAMAVLLKWVGDLESVLQSEKVQLGSVKSMDYQLDMYKELMRDIEDHTANQEYINKTGRELIARSLPDKAGSLEKDLASLNSRWLAVTTTIEQRQARLEKAISQMKEYQQDGLNRWMDEMDVFLHAEDPATGDIPALQAQLQESKGVQDDIKTLQLNVKSINSIAKSFMDDADPQFKEKLKAEVAALNARWDQIVTFTQEQHERLTSRLSSSQGIYDRIEGITTWLSSLKQDLANKDYSVESPNDLQVKNKKFKSLKKEVSEREAEVNGVNDEANAMLHKAPSGSLQELARSLMKMNALWGDVCQRVDRYTTLYETSEMQWRELKATSSDAEDISEELNEMETLLQDHEQENKRRIQDLAGELISNSIMTDVVQRELDEFMRKFDSLESEAKSKISRLEQSIQRAQIIERQMLEMSQWMGEISQHLQSRLDADLLAGDMPQEYESLKEEFSQQEALLRELEDHVTQYRQQGKMEASARLEQQTQLLKKHFAEVMVKFRKFQRPAEFEPKLSHVKRELDNIQERIHLLEVPSDDPQAIQERLDTCMKYYKTMSELKPEVEYVIKTGRTVVERKQVDFPEKLSKQLDAIKQLYNDLGAQVTHSKADLDKALKLSRKLRKEITAITDFINETNTELSKRQSPKQVHNVDDELAYIKKVMEEMQLREGALKTIHELIQQLQGLAEEADVTESRQEVYTINQDWTELSLRLARLKGSLQEENTSLDGQFIDFQSQILKVKDWLGRTENILSSHSRLSEQQQAMSPHTETVKQTLLLQMNEMWSQVDEVRDLAISLMSRSSRFTAMVEPELTHLNQRWEEVSQMLKAKQNQQQELTTSIEASKVTVTHAAKTSSPAPESPRPKTEGEGEFTLALESLQRKISSFENNISTKGKLLDSDFTDNIEANVQVSVTQVSVTQLITEEAVMLQEQVKIVMDEGEQLLSRAESCRDPVTHARVSNKLQDLKARWTSVQTDTEAKRRALTDIAPLWYQFSRADQDIVQWFESAEKRLAKGDVGDVE